MGDVIPFFYYDILARIIPGAFTLSTFLVFRDTPYVGALLKLFEGADSWKAVIIPLVLGGLCYLIGVVYEAVAYASIPQLFTVNLQNRAFDHARTRFLAEGNQEYSELVPSSSKNDKFRTNLWEQLVYEGSKSKEASQYFAHSHRFQAEYKMFLHLVGPAMLYALMSWSRGHLWRGIIGATLVPILFALSYRRDSRRWWQVLSSARQLGFWKQPKDGLWG